MNALENFLGAHSQEAKMRSAIGNFDTLTPEKRIEFRELWSKRNKMWAHKKLVQDWGFDCDSDNDGCNPHLGQMGPMRGEGGYGEYAGDN